MALRSLRDIERAKEALRAYWARGLGESINHPGEREPTENDHYLEGALDALEWVLGEDSAPWDECDMALVEDRLINRRVVR